LNQRGFKVQVTSIDSPSSWQSQLFESLPDAVLLDVSIASDLGWEELIAIKGSQTAKEIPVLFSRIRHPIMF